MRVSSSILSIICFTALQLGVSPTITVANAQSSTEQRRTEMLQGISGSTPKEPKKLEVRTGIIASEAGRGQNGAIAVETGGASPGDAQKAIGGSISNTGRGCIATLINNSDVIGYRVRYQVIGKNERGSTALRKNFSTTLKPSGKSKKEFSCRDDYTMKLELKSATPIPSRN